MSVLVRTKREMMTLVVLALTVLATTIGCATVDDEAQLIDELIEETTPSVDVSREAIRTCNLQYEGNTYGMWNVWTDCADWPGFSEQQCDAFCDGCGQTPVDYRNFKWRSYEMCLEYTHCVCWPL